MVKLEVLLLGGCVNSPQGPYGLSSTSEQSLGEIADSQRQESAPAGVADLAMSWANEAELPEDFAELMRTVARETGPVPPRSLSRPNVRPPGK